MLTTATVPSMRKWPERSLTQTGAMRVVIVAVPPHSTTHLVHASTNFVRLVGAML